MDNELKITPTLIVENCALAYDVYDEKLKYIESIFNEINNDVVYIQKFGKSEELKSLPSYSAVHHCLEYTQVDELAVNIIPAQTIGYCICRSEELNEMIQKYRFMGFRDITFIGKNDKCYRVMIYKNNKAGIEFFQKYHKASIIDLREENKSKDIENMTLAAGATITVANLYTVSYTVYDKDFLNSDAFNMIKNANNGKIAFIQKNFKKRPNDDEYLNSFKNADCILKCIEEVSDDELLINLIPSQIKSRNSEYDTLIKKYEFLGFEKCTFSGDDYRDYDLMIYKNNSAGKKYLIENFEELDESEEKLYDEINKLEQDLYSTAVNFVDTLLLLIRKTNEIRKED